MKNIQWLSIALLAACLQAHAQQNNMQRAQQILQWMKNAQSDSIYACFDAKMQQAVPLSQLNNTLDLHLRITDKIERINLCSKERMQEVNL